MRPLTNFNLISAWPQKRRWLSNGFSRDISQLVFAIRRFTKENTNLHIWYRVWRGGVSYEGLCRCVSLPRTRIDDWQIGGLRRLRSGLRRPGERRLGRAWFGCATSGRWCRGCWCSRWRASISQVCLISFSILQPSRRHSRENWEWERILTFMLHIAAGIFISPWSIPLWSICEWSIFNNQITVRVFRSIKLQEEFWKCVVKKVGSLVEGYMGMGKSRMNRVWSSDAGYSAQTLSETRPRPWLV